MTQEVLYGTIHIVLFVGLRVLRMCATKEDMNKGTVLQGTKTSYLALMQTLALTLHSLKCREELERRPQDGCFSSGLSFSFLG